MWTEVESEMACAEGWDVISPEDPNEAFIGCLDEQVTLLSDGDAWEWVVQKAKEGSALHMQALASVSRFERERIKAHTGY